MTSDDYNVICNQMLTVAMKYVNTSQIKCYANIDKKSVNGGDIIYKSAVADKSPITLVYTPAGTGKSSLIKERINAMIRNGEDPAKILVLNMNIAKAKQMKNEISGVNAMTFCDFIHGIFTANNDNFSLADSNTVTNLLRVKSDPNDAIAAKFINTLSMIDPQDRTVMSALMVNQNLDKIYNLLKSIGRIDYSLESIICHNMMYRYPNNPYDVNAIIINGIHNMPVPILCTIIEYVNRYHCNLFMTGSTEETIYEFNMAYKNSMDVIAAYSDKGIGIVRLSKSVMTESIDAAVNQKRVSALTDIRLKSLNSRFANDNTIMTEVFSPEGTDYISSKLAKKEQILIVTRLKSDIPLIQSAIEKFYSSKFPQMSILNIADLNPPDTEYSTMLARNINALRKKYTTMDNQTIGFELYEMFEKAIGETKSVYRKNMLTAHRDNLVDFIKELSASVSDESRGVDDAVISVIDYESSKVQAHMDELQNKSTMDFRDADIILSTIHSAIDIRNDNVVVFFRNLSENDAALYRVAMSRANKTAYVIFVNNGTMTTKFQRYLTLFTTTCV